MNSYVLILLSSVCLTACVQAPSEREIPSGNPLQNTEEAVRFFEDEMNFTAGPGGVKNALAGGNAIVVDVRREADFKAGHIPGAINLPFDKWEKFEGSQTSFPFLKKDKFNYVYCYELLCNLGAKAAKKFASLGYPVKEVKGGFASWKDHKYPVEK